jgi:hypothetical protein
MSHFTVFPPLEGKTIPFSHPIIHLLDSGI